MKKPLQLLLYKLVVYAIILLAGLALGAVNTTNSYGIVLPAMLTVFTIRAIVEYVKETKKANDKSKIDFL